MHVVFNKPEVMRRDQVSEEEVAKEREILLAAAKADPKKANKPEQILAKIVEGQLGKFYAERCLLEQPFIKDDSKSVEAYVKASGLGVEIVDFAYIATDA